MPVPVGVYLRISDDYQERDEDRRKGVTRQLADCKAIVGVRRWETGEVYEDNDISAYKRGIVRPDFERMLEDLRAGAIRGVVAYDQDRLTRRPADLERLIDIYEDRPGYVYATAQGDIDLSTADGRTMARVMVAFANKSSADTGRRVTRVQQELARRGKPHGGASLTFGWFPDGSADPAAKEEIDKAHERILAGDKVAHIREDWEARSVYPTKGKRLHYSTVRRVLTRPELAGLKVYRGEVVTDEDGTPVKGAQAALCAVERLYAVLAALEERRPENAAPGGRSLRYLLTGIALCGACRQPLVGSIRTRGGRQYPGYLCNNRGRGAGCGKVVRSMKPVDDLIIDLTLADQARRRKTPEPAPSWQGEKELQAIQEEMSELIQAKNAGQISLGVLLQIMPDLERRQRSLLLVKRKTLLDEQRSKIAAAKTRDEFDALPLERQRALVLKSLEAVVIHPNGKANKRFNPDLIEPIWAP